MSNLNKICEFINDMIADTDIRATPGIGIIAWQRVFVGQGQYPVTKGEAYQRLVAAGYNPKALVEYATENAE